MGKTSESALNEHVIQIKQLLAYLSFSRIRVENIDYHFAENKFLIRNQKLLVK